MPGDERRRDLESLAYGQTGSAEEHAAARRELERLAGRRHPASAAGTPAAAPDDADVRAGEEPADGGQDPGPVVRTPWRPSRTLFVVGLATVLVVGLVGGAYVEAILRPVVITTTSPATASQVPPDPSATGRSTHFNGNPGTSTTAEQAVLAANALLAESPTKDDAYPNGGGANVTYDPSSTRLVATTPNKTRIWIARAAGTAGGYCLLSLDASTRPDANLGLASCSLPSEFVHGGVVLSVDGYDVTWTGGNVDVAKGN